MEIELANVNLQSTMVYLLGPVDNPMNLIDSAVNMGLLDDGAVLGAVNQGKVPLEEPSEADLHV